MERPLSVEDVIMWLEGLSKGTICQEVETVSMEGLQVVLAQKGFLRCNFLVPDRLSVSVSFL